MKIFIQSADLSGNIDAPVLNFLRMLHGLTESLLEADVVIVPITRYDNYKFNPKLYELNKPWVLVDFCEYGANDWDRKETHFFGFNTHKFKQFDSCREQYELFDKWVVDNFPKVIFKRELLEKDFRLDLRNVVHPIEYPCYMPVAKPETREEFNRRPIEAFHYFGFSHNSRVKLHSEFIIQKLNLGYEIIDNLNNFKKFFENNPPGTKRVFASLWIPDYARVDIKYVMAINALSKLSVSLPGAGVHCFRTHEVPSCSVMVLQQDNLSRTFDWLHGVNCIRTPLGNDMDSIKGGKDCPEFPAIIEALKRDDLFDIYQNGLETVDKYRVPKYLTDYIIPTIQKHL